MNFRKPKFTSCFVWGETWSLPLRRERGLWVYGKWGLGTEE